MDAEKVLLHQHPAPYRTWRCIMTKRIVVGIYQIRNTINNKIYIGSSIDIFRRWKEHKSDLRGNYHRNIYLQRSWNKYGKDAFAFKILEIVNEDDLISVEQQYLDERNPDYNIAKFAGTSPVKGRGHTEATKKKLADNWTTKDRQRRSNEMLGKNNHRWGTTWSEETRQKKMDWWTDERRDFQSKNRRGENHPSWGTHITEEHKRNLSVARSGEGGSNSILTWEDVREIRRLYATGDYTQQCLADRWNVHIMTINDILKYRTWKE